MPYQDFEQWFVVQGGCTHTSKFSAHLELCMEKGMFLKTYLYAEKSLKPVSDVWTLTTLDNQNKKHLKYRLPFDFQRYIKHVVHMFEYRIA